MSCDICGTSHEVCDDVKWHMRFGTMWCEVFDMLREVCDMSCKFCDMSCQFCDILRFVTCLVKFVTFLVTFQCTWEYLLEAGNIYCGLLFLDPHPSDLWKFLSRKRDSTMEWMCNVYSTAG